MRMEYNKTLYNTAGLKATAEDLLKHLPSDVDLLLSMGASGCSLASGMLALSDRPLCHKHFRKTGEKAHAKAAGEGNGCSSHQAVIVDDLIDTGATVREVIRKAKQENIEVSCILIGKDFRLDHEDIGGVSVIALE